MQENLRIIPDSAAVTPARHSAETIIAAAAAAGKKDVPIVFCADKNYGLYLPVVVQSIIENSSSGYHYHIIVFDCGIEREVVDALARQIRRHDNFSLHVNNIEHYLKKYEEAFIEKWHLTRAMYGRLFIPEICNEYKQVIYADIDMVFNRDIAELANIDLGGKQIAGIVDYTCDLERFFVKERADYMRDIVGLHDNDRYINSGLLVFDVRLCAQSGTAEKALSLLQKTHLIFPDQDAVNSAWKEKIYFLNSKWNCLPKKYFDLWENRLGEISAMSLVKAVEEWQAAYVADETCFHFIGPEKPWRDLQAKKTESWWRYAGKTEYYPRYLADLAIYSVKQLSVPVPVPVPIVQPESAPQSLTEIYTIFGLPFLKVKKRPNTVKYMFGSLRVAKKVYEKDTIDIYIFGLRVFRIRQKRV